MAPIARSKAHRRISSRIGLCLLFVLCLAITAAAQSATYRLHREASTTTNLFQLQTANPDATALAIQTANLKNVAAGEYVIKQFDTQSGVPNVSGTIPSGSTITFELWLKKTSTSGTMFPRAKLNLNSAAGTSLGVATSTTALTSTLTKYTFSTTTSTNISIAAGDRFYVWVGVNLTVAPTTNTNAELDVEGVTGGNYDSLVTVPLPPSAPSITNLSPSVGSAGTSVTISGANFGATQGSSTVNFNGVSATPSNWSNTSITCPVPAAATTGPVVVTVGGVASNGATFTVASVGSITGTITRTSDGSGLNGALVEALQGGVVKGSGTSDASGVYSINGLLSGTYDVRASAARFLTQTQTGISVTAPGASTANFSLVDAGPITNIYDELGRLIAVIDPAGEKATYTYDAVGNLLSITRSSASQISILEFTPNKAPIGAAVTIYGSAFSTTPGDNVVKFNGTTAVVTASSATQISTTVPVGATTGLITVTNANGTAASATQFIVGSDAPIITSFTPNLGSAGTTVSITGSNFDTTTTGNRVSFNNTARGIVNTATATSLNVTVPAGATSGHISDSTPMGTGTSTDLFFVPPPPFTAADVEVYGLMAIGESRAVTITTANKVAMELFDGTAGQRVSLLLNGVTISSGSIFIYKPDGTVIASAGFGTNGAFIDAFSLPVTGTYTILIDPANTSIGNATINLYGITDATGTITVGGPAAVATTTIPGQNAVLSFSATAGQRVSVKGVASLGACWTMTMFASDNTQLATTFSCGNTIFFEPLTIPATGNYTLLIDPSGAAVGQATVNLYQVTDITGTLNFGGPAFQFTTDTPGQNAILSFSGTAGQRASIFGTGNFGVCWNLGIYKPDGSQLTNVFSCGSSIMIEPQLLPDTGTYTVVVDPTGTGIGNSSITLYDVVDVTMPITINGPTLNVPLPTPGQNARLTFDGTAGQRISVNGVAQLGVCWTMSILKPDSSTLASVFSCGSGIFIEPQTLPVNGTYTIFIDPSGAGTGQVTVGAYDVVDFTSPITLNGPTVQVNLPTPGQNGRLTFDGTAGQRISVNGNAALGVCWTLALLKPDGSTLASVFSCGSNIFIEPQTLPTDGTYTVLVDPSGAGTGTVTVGAYNVVDFTSPITLSGPSVIVQLPTPGQNGRLTFDGTAGQRVSVNGNAALGVCWTLAILKPDGSSLSSVFSCGSGIFIEPQTLPTSGTYTVLVDPSGAGTGQVTVNAYSTTDFTSPITLNGPTVQVNLPTPGQNGRLTFDGTAGQRISVNGNAALGVCWTLAILKPDATTLASVFGCGSNIFIEPQTLPTSGTYTVLVDPSGAGTGTVTVGAYNVVDFTSPITLSGSSVLVSLPTPGQNGRLTFDGAAGQRVSVNGSAALGVCWTLALLKPDGSTLNSVFGCGSVIFIEPQTLPTAGTYTVLVDPSGPGTGTVTTNAYNVVDVTGPITFGGPAVNSTLSTPGQTARLTFDGTAGQRVSVNSTSSGMTGCWTLLFLKPDGSTLASVFTCGSGAFIEPQTLPSAGTYTVVVDPSGNATGQSTVTIYNIVDGTGSLTVNGGAVPVNITMPGQNATLSFTGTASQQTTVRVTGSTMSCVTVTLFKPDGTSQTSTFSCSSTFNLATQTLPVSGTYTIKVDASGPNTGTMNLSVTNP